MLRNIIPQMFCFRDPMATTLKLIPIPMPTPIPWTSWNLQIKKGKITRAGHYILLSRPEVSYSSLHIDKVAMGILA